MFPWDKQAAGGLSHAGKLQDLGGSRWRRNLTVNVHQELWDIFRASGHIAL
jgi:hypothetical protein